MAAQAVDFTISGHVAQALVITDKDGSTRAQVKDSGSSGSRIRVVGSGETMDGGTAGVLLEYGAGGNGGAPLSLRYADLHFGGEFGKISVGHGDQGGEGSVYNDKSGVLGIGHGQERGASVLVGDYFGSLDGGGGRNGRVRYDTPSVGPVSASVSIGNGDQISAGVKISQDFDGTSFGAMIGTLQKPGDASTISASAGVKLPSGITVSGAWGSARNMMGPTDMGGMPGMEGMKAFQINPTEPVDLGDNPVTPEILWFKLDALEKQIRYENKEGTAGGVMDLTPGEVTETKRMYNKALMAHECKETTAGGTSRLVSPTDPRSDTDSNKECSDIILSTRTTYEVPGGDDVVHIVDPSFLQATVGYVFGDTSVAVSWYQSSDFQRDGSEGTALGIGFNHNLPKIGANVWASAQNHSVDKADGSSVDDTVVTIGTRIKF